MYTIEFYDFINEENRYIILDKNGFDLYGEHFNLKEAKQEIKYMQEEDKKNNL